VSALTKPEGVGPDWWGSVLRVAASSASRSVFDAQTRSLLHDVYQAYQTIEGNAISSERKAFMSNLRTAARGAWYAMQTGATA